MPSENSLVGSSAQKTVHVLPSEVSSNLLQQALYLDRETMTLIPNRVFINEDGEVLFEINSLGLRGPEPDDDQRFAVVWGDSVVFSEYGKGWPEQIEDATLDCLFLNGGIEGTTYIQTLKRAVDFNRRRQAALNLIMLGWFPLPGNQRLRSDLECALDEIPNPVLITMPTSLNSAIAGSDISSSFRLTYDDDRFWFFGRDDYSVPLQMALYAHICERNDIIRRVSVERNVPLLDLFAAFDSRHLDDFRKFFFDISHPRPAAYPMLATMVREGMRPLLRRER